MTHRPSVRHLATALVLSIATALHAQTETAFAALQHGRIDEAVALLQPELTAHPANAEVHRILCRAAYAVDDSDAAIAHCRTAIQLAPRVSNDHLWLGRALGLKAAHANPIAAINLAKQVRAEFETAVQLDPANLAAASDLGEFYIGAPSFIGGSQEKARKVAIAIQPRDPARAHRLLALIAQKADDLSTAEAEFKSAIEIAHKPEAYVDLAIFYQQNKMLDNLVPTINQALAADRLVTPVQVDAASILIEAHRAQPLAIQALRNYLKSDAQTDAAPVFKVHVQLGHLLAKSKDTEGARREFKAALALASHFEPAEKALRNLQ